MVPIVKGLVAVTLAFDIEARFIPDWGDPSFSFGLIVCSFRGGGAASHQIADTRQRCRCVGWFNQLAKGNPPQDMDGKSTLHQVVHPNIHRLSSNAPGVCQALQSSHRSADIEVSRCPCWVCNQSHVFFVFCFFCRGGGGGQGIFRM